MSPICSFRANGGLSQPDVMPAEEGVKLEPGAMETLGKVAGGDMRKAITTLQSAVRLKVRCAMSGRLSTALQ